jgi:hypothetical protein
MCQKEGGPPQFLCQERLSETHFVFSWKQNKDLENTKYIFVFETINPKQIDPIIDSTLAKGFNCWLLEIPQDADKIERTKMIPIGFRKEEK